jgi:putative copper resistance protein D
VLDPITIGVLLSIGSAYVAGLVRSRRLRRPVGRGRVAAFAGGWIVLTLALVSPIDAYADVSFSVHMLQHLLLTLVVPPLLALAAPISLAFASLPPDAARTLAKALRSPLARLLANPVVGWALFVGVPIAVHASRLFDAALTSTGWHAFEHALWVGAALVYWWPIVGADPSPHPVSYGARMLSLLLAMPAMSFLALAIYTADTPLYATYASLPAPWGPDALADQRDAAVLMWIAGNLALVVAMLLVAASWKRHDDEVQRRLEAREDAAAPSTV